MSDTSQGGAYKPTAYKDMPPARKVRWLLKLVACIVTFGFAFPNIMSD